MDDYDNATLQAEELEALAAIYGDDWRMIDGDRQVFSIDILVNDQQQIINFQITLPTGYPKKEPPIYQVGAPWLSREQRRSLTAHLESIYSEHIGDCIIYTWIEAIKDYLEKAEPLLDLKPDNDDSSGDEEEDPVSSLAQELDEATLQPWKQFSAEQRAPEGRQCPDIHDTEISSDRKSKFQGHLARVNEECEVHMVIDKLRENRKIDAATHNMYAYRIYHEPSGTATHPVLYEGSDDDGEHTASRKMLHMLSIMDARNVVVVVTRWYGGIHLGQDRFKHINNITRQLLEEHGFVKIKQAKKGTKGSKGSK